MLIFAETITFEVIFDYICDIIENLAAEIGVSKNDVVASRISDFKIGSRTFEVGGKNKGSHQLEGAENGTVVKDDIEYGHGNVVPLWAFGLNY